MDKKIYCGKGKKQSDTWIKATINPDVIVEHIEEFKGNKFVKLNINILEQPDKYGKDVSITVDTWKPEKNYSKPKEEIIVPGTDVDVEKIDVDEIPF